MKAGQIRPPSVSSSFQTRWEKRGKMRGRIEVGLGIVSAVVLVAGVAWVVPRQDVPIQFWSSPLRTVRVQDRQLRVVVVSYQTGLRDVPTLGGLDGALFLLDHTVPAGAGMGMDDVVMPLDVVFFGPDGQFIERFTMPLCEEETCPVFTPSTAWRAAIEGPAGSLAWVSDAAVLLLPD